MSTKSTGSGRNSINSGLSIEAWVGSDVINGVGFGLGWDLVVVVVVEMVW